MKNLFIVILTVYSCTISKANVELEQKKLIDTLFSDGIERYGNTDYVVEILNRFADYANRDSLYFAFALKSQMYRSDAIVKLINSCSPFAAKYLELHSEKLIPEEYFQILRTAGGREMPCYNLKLMKQLIKIAKNDTIDLRVSATIAKVVRYNGSLKDVKSLSELLGSQAHSEIKSWFCITICRYNDQQLNELFLKHFNGDVNYQNIINFGIKPFNRYDLLPVLSSLRSKLVTIKYPDSKTKETLTTLSEIISYLERKKAENAPIGLPLDWPDGNVRK